MSMMCPSRKLINEHLMRSGCLLLTNISSTALEHTVHEYIIPTIMDDKERTERLITVFGSFDQKGKIAFLALVRKQKR